MDFFTGRVSLRCFGVLSLLLIWNLVSDPLRSQILNQPLEVRAGQGWSMTSPAVRSMVLSVPSHRLDEIDSWFSVYVNQSVTLLHQHRHIGFIVSATPMFLLESATEFPRLSIEAGIGANVVSVRELGGRRLGSNFLFSPTLGAGIEVPWMNNVVGVSYLFRHLSNAGFFEDNDGVNFQYIIFTMRFRNP